MNELFNTIRNMNPDIVTQLVNLKEGDEILSQNNQESFSNVVYGCKHYMRKCKIISPCCNNTYDCRLCHDENETHEINRFDISQIICSKCNTQQSPSQYCVKCFTCFGLYYCDICRLFDDVNKEQFHCVGCGFCRIGGKHNFTHCYKCNMCIPNTSIDNHKCLVVKDSTCPICIGDLFTSVQSVTGLKCGHYIHNQCLVDMLNTNYKCPVCMKSIVDTTNINQFYDNEIINTPIPEDLAVDIKASCIDCDINFDTKYHIVGIKCVNCGGYNTRQI